MANLFQQLEPVTIRNRDDNYDFITFYNPKELALDQNVKWSEHDGGRAHKELEYTGAPAPMTLSCELFCDLYEERGNVDLDFVEPLLELTRPVYRREEGAPRPPVCIFLWGKGFRRFQCVVESVSVKYTMFLADGTPCRATATPKMKHAPLIKVKSKTFKPGYGEVKRGDYSGGTTGAGLVSWLE